MKVMTVDKRAANFYAKACPRCYGDMYKGKGLCGEFIGCYQCGYEKAEPKLEAVRLASQRYLQGFAAENALSEPA